MLFASRKFAFVLLAVFALAAAGCGGNASKIVGKWKVVSGTGKDGKEQKLEIFGMSPIMEFTSDGNVKVGMDVSGMPPEFKPKDDDKEAAAKMQEMKQVGKYKVSGDTIEFLDMGKAGNSPVGKNNKGKLKIDGDNLTISGDDGSLKLSRMK